MQIPGWPESTQIQWEHRVWRAGYPVKLAGSCFLSSQHNEWFATRDRAVGSSYRQRKFPMCLEQRREAVAFGQILSLSAASVLSAAAAGLLPSLLSHQASCAGGLRKVTIQCCYGHSWDSWLCTPSLWQEEQSTLPFLQHHPVPSIQLYWAYTQTYRSSTVHGHLTQGWPALDCKNIFQPHLHLSGILQPGQQSGNPTRKGFRLGQVFK